MKPKGRSITSSKKNISIKFSVDDTMYEKLIFCARVLHKNKSEVIREAITESCIF